MRKAHDGKAKEKEVIVFLSQDAKVFYFDGTLATSDYGQMFPVVKKRKKRKKDIYREITYFKNPQYSN